MKDITKTLKNYFAGMGISQLELAEKLGKTQGYVSQLLNGHSAFGKAQALKWEKEFGINASWLLTGEGAMLVKDNVTANTNVNEQNIILGSNVATKGEATAGDVTLEADTTTQTIIDLFKEQQKQNAEQLKQNAEWQAIIKQLINKGSE